MNAGGWSAWSTVVTTANLSRSVSLSPGEYQFRLRAEDRAGNASPWMLGDVFSLRDPQGSPPISFSGRWATHSSSQYYDGSTRYASAQGRSAALAFTGRQIALVSTRGPNRGRAKIFVDGALVETVDLYAPTFQSRRVVFTELWGSADPHTIAVKVITRNASSSGSRVDLDAFVTLE
jgi:bacillopeptidase F